MENYNQLAEDFLSKTGVSIKIEFKKNDFHFSGDTDKRDIYSVTLLKGARSFTFDFGQCITYSGEFIVKDKNPKITKIFSDKVSAMNYSIKVGNGSFGVIKNPYKKVPTAYDILSCLTKYDPDTFENFCSEFGYDTDSKKAEKTYNAVKDEYKNICTIFTDAEIEELQEIN